MGTVLDEITSDTVEAKDIEKRVTDWERRVNSLYDTIEGWLPTGWTACRDNSVFMYEALMRKFGIRGQEIPTLELHDRGSKAVTIEPRGLWIVGANGRVDLKHDGKHYIIVDSAENFQKPKWMVFGAEDRNHPVAVTKEWLQEIFE